MHHSLRLGLAAVVLALSVGTAAAALDVQLAFGRAAADLGETGRHSACWVALWPADVCAAGESPSTPPWRRR